MYLLGNGRSFATVCNLSVSLERDAARSRGSGAGGKPSPYRPGSVCSPGEGGTRLIIVKKGTLSFFPPKNGTGTVK